MELQLQKIHFEYFALWGGALYPQCRFWVHKKRSVTMVPLGYHFHFVDRFFSLCTPPAPLFSVRSGSFLTFLMTFYHPLSEITFVYHFLYVFVFADNSFNSEKGKSNLICLPKTLKKFSSVTAHLFELLFETFCRNLRKTVHASPCAFPKNAE